MRIGFNPEKKKSKEIEYKKHRVIIPVYIPDSDEKYFENLFLIFKASLNSLLKTTDKSLTNITIINNNCKKEITDFIDKLLANKKIDKHVKLSTNYGKVYTILSEVKATYEELITIADADVLYLSNWLENTVSVFNNFKKAGVVAPLPMPQLAFYCNYSMFYDNLFKIKKGNIILKEDLLLFEKSVNSKISLNKNNWFKNQLYLEKNNTKICIGAGHFIATYRREVIENIKLKKPEFVFENGAETVYLDQPIDKLGYYRLSTLKTYAYHIGNQIPEWITKLDFKIKTSEIKINEIEFENSIIPYKVKKIVSKIYRKINTV